MTPPLVDDVVRRCLAKNPDDRWQSAADPAFALKSISWNRESRPPTRRLRRSPTRQVRSARVIAEPSLSFWLPLRWV